ncbi:MAG: GNAT family N-acetyltransferase [Phycisphaerae bacterium]|nr:GNAT family N-acetyltransferase [Phycisphaerae bacterium]
MTEGLSVLVLYNTNPPDMPRAFAESELGVLDEVNAVCKALTELGIPHRSVGVKNLREVAGNLATSAERIVFNLVEGFAENHADAMMVPSLCRAWRRGWTGNDTAAQLLTLDKWQTKAALRQNGLPTPQALIIDDASKIRGELFPGPYIVKPLCADASEGIDSRSVVTSRDDKLYAAVQRIHDQFGHSAMIEQYIDGRELNVSVLWKDNAAKVLPLAEIDFSAFDASRVKIVGYEAKWRQDSFEYQNTPRVIPAPLPDEVARQVRELSIAACRAVGCDDYCRVDFRLDDQLRPYILEINANPDISPDAGFAAALQAEGVAFSQFVAACIDRAHDRLRRHSLPSTPVPHGTTGTNIRHTKEGDLEPTLAMLEGTHFFYPAEVEVAREVLAEAIAHGPTGHYQSLVLEENGRILGWICFGPTPCTLGTFDIYWLAIDQSTQGRGLGTLLLDDSLRRIADREGRLVIVETSGRERYDPTRAFYEKRGFALSARSKDFYAPGDDKIIYTRFLA